MSQNLYINIRYGTVNYVEIRTECLSSLVLWILKGIKIMLVVLNAYIKQINDYNNNNIIKN